MLLETLSGLLIFFLTILGVGWPLVRRLHLAATEKLAVSVAAGLLGIFLLAWVIYLCALPAMTFWILPALALAGIAFERRTLAELGRDPAARILFNAQLLVTLWCIGWLALVVTYSGGSWTGDWFGHWQRTAFFLEHLPRDTLFNGFDPVVSRPPLANIVTGAFLRLTHDDFAHYQLFSTLLASLAFLPAGLLAQRWGGARASAVLAVLFMLNPLFVENVTYAWTKLPAAFFVLVALHFFLRATDTNAPRSALMLCAASLAAGILTHYSVGPWVVLLVTVWLAIGWKRRAEIAWWNATRSAGIAGGLVLATWFGWAIAIYGMRPTFFSNTAVTDQAPTRVAQLARAALNLRDTLVPHFLRGADLDEFAQRSPWGWWRDWFFPVYQTNLLLAFGSVAVFALAAVLIRRWRITASPRRGLWVAGIAGVIVLGVGVHGARETLGLAHICLQPLVLLGLAALAANLPELPAGWRLALIAGATVDFLLGIALQFGVESRGLDHVLIPGRPESETLLSYSQFAVMNLRAKLVNQWTFFGDHFAPHAALVATALAALLLIALVRAQRAA